MQEYEMRNELVKRYQYLDENAEYLLAPFMHEQTKEERKILNDEYKFLGLDIFITDICAIYLSKLPHELLIDLESFLLSADKMENSNLFHNLEEEKYHQEYLTSVQKGVALLNKENTRMGDIVDQLDIWRLLNIVRDFINNQPADLKNKDKKLHALNAYFRLFCLKSGQLMPLSSKKKNFNRYQWDTGIENNEFINYFFNNEKYINYHNLDVLLTKLSTENDNAKRLVKEK